MTSLLLNVVTQVEFDDASRSIKVWKDVRNCIRVVDIFSVNPHKLLGDSHSLYGLTLSTVSVQQERAARRELDGDGEKSRCSGNTNGEANKVRLVCFSPRCCFLHGRGQYPLYPIPQCPLRTPWDSPGGESC